MVCIWSTMCMPVSIFYDEEGKRMKNNCCSEGLESVVGKYLYARPMDVSKEPFC